MSAKYELEQDMREAVAMVKGLEAYVRGTELYGNAGGGFFSRMPALTVGALVMRLRRLDVLRAQLNSAQSTQLREIQQQHALTRREWAVHYDEKVLREVKSRLDAMNAFFKECADAPKQAPTLYPPEASRRTIAQELVRVLQEQGELDKEVSDKLLGADSRLRQFAKPSAFIWSSLLEPVYPPSEFWWLYAKPPTV
jgi:hypothetical protein